MRSEGRQRQWFGIWAGILALVMGLAVSGGCASSDSDGATESGSKDQYPNLGDVPERPATMTEEQRRQLEQGLVADSQQPEYSHETIAFQAEPAESLPDNTGIGDATAINPGGVVMPSTDVPPVSGALDMPAGAGDSTPAAMASDGSPAAPTVATAPSVPVSPVPQPTAAYVPPSPSYAPVPDAPPAVAGDGATADLNRSQLEAVQPTPLERGDGDLTGRDVTGRDARSQAGAVPSGVAASPPAGPSSSVPTPAAGAQQASLSEAAIPSASAKVATILFSEGSSDLRAAEREIIRTVYKRYLSGGRRVRVVGHASGRTRKLDPVHHRTANLGISVDRANAVALELRRLGVAQDRITVVGAADDMPVYLEVMPSGEAANRRAEIYLD